MRQVISTLGGSAVPTVPTGVGPVASPPRSTRRWDSTGAPGVRLTVADTGYGMSPEVRRRIFEAFFTTKEATGTGLGLWVSHEIIAKHHGLIRVRSRVPSRGRTSGTVFHIFLPDDENLSNLHAMSVQDTSTTV